MIDWSGQPCAVIASGVSATEAAEQIKGQCRVIVVNNGFKLAPWADVLYAADARWWDTYRDALAFSGLKVTASLSAAKRLGLQHVQIKDEADPNAHLMTLDGPIGHGGNSGFQALNLALQSGSRHLLLVGFDYCGAHWHEKHPEPLLNPRPQTLDKWRSRLDAQASWFKAIGAEVFNASCISTLKAFPKIDVGQFVSETRRAA